MQGHVDTYIEKVRSMLHDGTGDDENTEDAAGSTVMQGHAETDVEKELNFQTFLSALVGAAVAFFNYLIKVCLRPLTARECHPMSSAHELSTFNKCVIVFMCNGVLDVCGKAGQWQRALELLDDMAARWGVQPDVVSFNTVISACGRAGEWGRAVACLVPGGRGAGMACPCRGRATPEELKRKGGPRSLGARSRRLPPTRP